MKQQVFKGMSIKTRFYNQANSILHDVVTDNPSWSKYPVRALTEKEKVETFDKLFSNYLDSKYELNSYKAKRKYKNEVQRLREERKKNKPNVRKQKRRRRLQKS